LNFLELGAISGPNIDSQPRNWRSSRANCL